MKKVFKKATSLILSLVLLVTMVFVAGVTTSANTETPTLLEKATDLNLFSLYGTNPEKIKIHGRLTDHSKYLMFGSSASGLEFKAYCSGDVKLHAKIVNVRTPGTANEGNGERDGFYYTSVVDGVVQQSSLRVPSDNTYDAWTKNSTGYSYYNKSKGTVYLTLATGLEEGWHTFKFLNQTPATQTYFGIDTVSINCDATGFADAPANKDLFIEFVGDGITMGTGNLLDGSADTTDYSQLTDNDAAVNVGAYNAHSLYTDPTRGWAALTAETLDADYSLVGNYGIAATEEMNWSFDTTTKTTRNNAYLYATFPYLYDKACFGFQDVAYDFARQPDVIVMGLGTNDVWLKNYTANTTYANYDIKAGFVSALQLLRSKNPNAKIIWIYGMITDAANDDIIAAVAEAGGAANNMYAFNLPMDTNGGFGRPGLANQQTYANTLSAEITSLLSSGGEEDPEPTYEYWNDKLDYTALQGEGTSEKPFEIATEGQLANLVKTGGEAGAYYKLTKDMYLNEKGKMNTEGYTNIAWFNSLDVTEFQGNFDGAYHTVYGIFSDYEDDGSTADKGNTTALFPLTKGGADVTIKNLGVADSYIKNSKTAAAIVGYAGNTSDGKLTIKNCFVESDVTVTGNAAGGIFGSGSINIDIINCSSKANLVTTAKKGLAANWWDNTGARTLTVTSSYSTGNIIGNKGTAVDCEENFTATGANALDNTNLDKNAWYAVKDDNKMPMLRSYGAFIKDMDENGVYEADKDLPALRAYLVESSTNPSNGDINNSGVVDICDLLAFKKFVG